MGRDTISPFVEAARAAGAGVLILVRTSNPGAADIEDLRLEGGETVWERIASAGRRARPTGPRGLGAQRRRRGRWSHGTGASGKGTRADGRRHLPAARHRRPGRAGRGSQGRLLARLGRRPGERLQEHRRRPWDQRRRSRRRGPPRGRIPARAGMAAVGVDPRASAERNLSSVPRRSASLCVVDAEAPLALLAYPMGVSEPR